MKTKFSTDLKLERLNLRLPKAIKERIERAAAVSGQSVTEFAIAALARTAEQVLGESETRRLSVRDRERFLEILDDADAPNNKLLAAAEAYKERFGR